MTRYEIINHLIRKYGYKRYLEIGTQNDVCLSNVKCDYKVGVEPNPVNHDAKNSTKFYKMKSDDYFCKHQEKFGIIFIDGLHESAQVYKDILNALEILTPRGTIIVHDCSPPNERAQTPAIWNGAEWAIPHLPTWNGDVWRSWVGMRTKRKDLSMYVVDTDQGCGVIRRGKQKPIVIDIPLKEVGYSHLEENRKAWLNLITIDEFKKL